MFTIARKYQKHMMYGSFTYIKYLILISKRTMLLLNEYLYEKLFTFPWMRCGWDICFVQG